MVQRYRVIDPDRLREAIAKSHQRVVPHSARSLARIAGMSHTGVANLWKKGEQPTIDGERAARIAAAIGHTRDDLFVPVLSESADADKITDSDQGGLV